MQPSELILNAKGHLYHLDIGPEHLGDIVWAVGDPGRVSIIAQRFDEVLYENTHREFTCCLGRSGKTHVLALSTGMGSDNIEIVINELDALANIHLPTRKPHESLRKLHIIRLGTSGSICNEVQPGDLVVSASAIGIDLLGQFYGIPTEWRAMSSLIAGQLSDQGLTGYFTQGDQMLLHSFGRGLKRGFTLSLPGFYFPQYRHLRLPPKQQNLIELYRHLEVDRNYITNLEMETAAYYLLGRHFGHATISLNAILANRLTGHFHPNPDKVIDKLIDHAFDQLGVWVSIQEKSSA